MKDEDFSELPLASQIIIIVFATPFVILLIYGVGLLWWYMVLVIWHRILGF